MNTDIRLKFLIPNSLYFLNHAVGCLPRNSRLAAERFFFSWQNFGNEAWDSWRENIERFKTNLAKLLSANCSSEICPQVNVSAGVSKIISSLPRRAHRSKILISESAFSSVGFAAQIAASNNYEIEFIAADCSYETILDNWESKLSDDVQAVIITHVLSNNSLCYPVKKIIEIAKAKNIFTIVDVAASVGVVPISLTNWDADFVVGTCIKWLCGGTGTGFLWVNKQKIEQFEPKEVGWFSHQDPFEFNIRNFEYAADAQRFSGGTPSILPYIIAAESIQVLLNIGMKKIYEHNQFLVRNLIKGLEQFDVKINSPLDQHARGGTVVIELPEMIEIKTYFSDNALWIDQRTQGFRISPHIYNELKEIEVVLELIEDFQSNGVGRKLYFENTKFQKFGTI
jgi:kynureninase